MSTASHLSDRGSATIMGVALLAVLALGATVVAMTVQASQLRSYTQGVADVAALAAAHEARDARANGELSRGGAGVSSHVCVAANEVVERNGLRLGHCEVHRSGAVTVEVIGERGPWTLARRARAGTN